MRTTVEFVASVPSCVAKVDGTTTTLARDGGKSVRAEVNDLGIVTGSYRYRAYGEAAQSSGSGPTHLGYAGQLTDPSGLLYMRARWYDPAAGRFLTRDPLRGDPAAPRTLNAYGYGGANPLGLVDPSGLAFTSSEEEAGGHCRRVRWCGEWIGAVLDEPEYAIEATRSSNPWIAATGYVEIGAAVTAAGAATAAAAGVGVAAATIARGIASAGAISTAGTNGVVVIGEAAGRVQQTAAAMGAIAYRAVNMPAGPWRMWANMRFVEAAMESELTIVNIGRDPARVAQGVAMGAYYAAEVARITAASYQYYYPILRR